MRNLFEVSDKVRLQGSTDEYVITRVYKRKIYNAETNRYEVLLCATAVNFFGYEIDINSTQDNVIVSLHDAQIELRLSDCKVRFKGDNFGEYVFKFQAMKSGNKRIKNKYTGKVETIYYPAYLQPYGKTGDDSVLEFPEIDTEFLR